MLYDRRHRSDCSDSGRTRFTLTTTIVPRRSDDYRGHYRIRMHRNPIRSFDEDSSFFARDFTKNCFSIFRFRCIHYSSASNAFDWSSLPTLDDSWKTSSRTRECGIHSIRSSQTALSKLTSRISIGRTYIAVDYMPIVSLRHEQIGELAHRST